MDIVSHGLWGGIAFGRKHRRNFWLAFFFGILPDLFSFGPFFVAVYLGLAERPHFSQEPPDPSLIPAYVHRAYSVTHSLVVFLLAFALLWVVFRKPIWEACAWGLHILFDIFTHSYRFFPTPFLWPMSDVKVNGWPWGMPAIFIPNVILLALLYAWFFLRQRRAPKRSSHAFLQGEEASRQPNNAGPCLRWCGRPQCVQSCAKEESMSVPAGEPLTPEAVREWIEQQTRQADRFRQSAETSDLHAPTTGAR